MIRFVGLLIAIALAFWVYHDAKKRGKTPGKALTWAAGVLFLWIVFFPLWLFTRPKQLVEEGSIGHMKVFPSCGGYMDREASFAPIAATAFHDEEAEAFDSHRSSTLPKKYGFFHPEIRNSPYSSLKSIPVNCHIVL